MAPEPQFLVYRSFGYRRLEFALGGKSPETAAAYAAVPRLRTLIEATLRAPSLYDAALALLMHRGVKHGKRPPSLTFDVRLTGRELAIRAIASGDVVSNRDRRHPALSMSSAPNRVASGGHHR